MKAVAKTNRDAVMCIDTTYDANATMTKVNEALKEYGGYVEAYLQFVEAERNATTGTVDYKLKVVRDDK